MQINPSSRFIYIFCMFYDTLYVRRRQLQSYRNVPRRSSRDIKLSLACAPYLLRNIYCAFGRRGSSRGDRSYRTSSTYTVLCKRRRTISLYPTQIISGSSANNPRLKHFTIPWAKLFQVETSI